MNILWIDDEPSRFNSLKKVMNEIDTHTTWFAHGNEQIHYYLNCGIKFDFVLLDHDMPLMDGYKVAKNFLCEKNIPVIIVSNNGPAAKSIAAILTDYATLNFLAPITNPELIRSTIRYLVAEKAGYK